jgi:hypothetical protein
MPQRRGRWLEALLQLACLAVALGPSSQLQARAPSCCDTCPAQQEGLQQQQQQQQQCPQLQDWRCQAQLQPRALPAADAQPPPGAPAAEGPNYIVQFRHYAHAAQHRRALQLHLGAESASGWRWVARNNRAAALPTDFALLALQPSAVASIRASLASLEGVNGGWRQDGRRVGAGQGACCPPQGPLPPPAAAAAVRWMLGEPGQAPRPPDGRPAGSGLPASSQRSAQAPPPPLTPPPTRLAPLRTPLAGVHADKQVRRPAMAQGSSSSSSSGGEGEARDLFSVPDQVGRRTTRPTEGLGGGTQRRARAMLRGGPVTQLLHADKLWSQGFSGAGVKVGPPGAGQAGRAGCRPELLAGASCPRQGPGRSLSTPPRSGTTGPAGSAGPGSARASPAAVQLPSQDNARASASSSRPCMPQHAPAAAPARQPARSPPRRPGRWACSTRACAATTRTSGASRTAATGRTRTRCLTGWATAPSWRA